MATDPRNALHMAIIAHIKADARFDGVRVVQGWPDEDLELPCVAVDSGRTRERKARRPDYRTDDLGDGTLRNLQAMADVTFPINIDLWATTRTQRGQLEDALLALLDGPQPADFGTAEARPPGMRLTLEHYHDITTRVRLLDQQTQDREGARAGYYRTVLACEAMVPRVKVVLYTTVTEANTTLTVGQDIEV